MPQRIQRKRTAGWRRGDAVIVDRTSHYGNPFAVGADRVTLAGMIVPIHPVRDREHAVALYRQHVVPTLDLATVRRDLRGRDLACPCPLPEPGQPDHCHARVLMELANGEWVE